MSTSVSSGTVLSRRGALGLLGAAAAVPVLAACGGRNPAERSSAAVTLATTIATQQDQKFLTEWLGRFTEQTGIQVRTRFYPDQQYANSIQLLFQGDDRPDVFRLVKQPAEMPAAVLKGWIQPLDGFPELITTLERDYPAQARDATTSGLHVGEDLYGMPSLTHRPWGACRPLMYNAALMDKYGVGTPPTTWSELREAAEKITRDAKGEVFGFGLVGQIPEPLGVTVYALQNTAGPQMTDPSGTPINYQTGEPGAGHPSFVEAVALLRDLVARKVVPVGWENLKPPQFFQQFASGRVAMAVIPSWWSGEIRKLKPDIELGYAPLPVPDSGRKGYGAIGVAKNPGSIQPYWGISKGSANAAAAARVLAFLAGLEPQRAYYEMSKIPTALADKYADRLSQDDRRLLELARETQRLAPNPLTRSSGAITVLAGIAQNSPKPTQAEIFFDAINGKIDYKAAADELDAKLGRVFAEELKKVQDKGVDIDRGTFTFADWDPMKDYTTR
ncbi:extracellular solute-binding protein [Nonomuraea sp. NBC_00507]|uniref:ABC transporter substrate-binding protein n=1 Tax=Nonomuraea sp. NBC_00507 TaxID=2976002 RepID=UPI002E1937DF